MWKRCLGRMCDTAWALAALLLLVGASPPPASNVRLEVATPADGAELGGPRGLAFVTGSALAVFGEYRTFDIVFVLDTSHSTGDPAGPGIEGNGEKKKEEAVDPADRILPRWSPPKRTILAAEVEAVRTLLGQLDPRTTRVGVVSFAGDTDLSTPDAQTEIALTDDYERVEKALAGILRRRPSGLTNMEHALNLALVELLGTESAESRPRPDARRVVVFLTDGDPNPPAPHDADRSMRAVLERVARARAAGVRIDSYALGREALDQPLVVVEMASMTGGTFTPVVRPADLRAVFEDIDLSEIAKLEVTNRTTGSPARQLAHNADGTFQALVDLQPGRNVLEVWARATDGSQARRRLVVSYAPGSPPQVLDAQQLAQRTRMLENELLELKRRNLEIEADRDEKLREALRQEIARERKAAEKKAAEARKELEIEAEQ
jgi:hypothetical protein